MEHEEPICKRGRPREFDADAALDAALAVFWRNGYDGTSLTDLTEAMGINRPSLYAAFGNKQALFRRAMERYAERPLAMLAACASEPTARAFTERLLRGTVDGATDGRGPTGCFLLQGAMRCGTDPIRQEMVERRAVVETLLRDRFGRAVACGELPSDACPADLARFFAAVAGGIAIRAADGADRAALHRVVDIALRAWPVHRGG